jgi:hypothetical protein
MVYRGVYQGDGNVKLEGGADLRLGTRVDVFPSGDGNGSRQRTRTRLKPGAGRGKSNGKSVHPFIALAGLWKDRPEWRGKSSVEVVAELRQRSAPQKSKRARRG